MLKLKVRLPWSFAFVVVVYPPGAVVGTKDPMPRGTTVLPWLITIYCDCRSCPGLVLEKLFGLISCVRLRCLLPAPPGREMMEELFKVEVRV